VELSSVFSYLTLVPRYIEDGVYADWFLNTCNSLCAPVFTSCLENNGVEVEKDGDDDKSEDS
jgi:hypothetical protein